LKQLLQFEMSLLQLAISLGDQVNFLSGSYSNRHEVYLNISCCDNRSDLASSHLLHIAGLQENGNVSSQ